MWWSKSKKSTPGAEPTESEPKDEITEPKDTAAIGSGGTASDSGEREVEEAQSYPGFKVVLPSVLAVCLTVFLTALDRTIVGVAVPTISNHFHSFNQIAWYESAFLLTNCAFQLPMGKVYTFFPTKWTFIAGAAIFEVGSIVCAAAPTSPAFIVGRAVAGIGSAGTFTGANLVFADLLPLEKRAKYLGFIGATFGLASIAGPLLGGVFTSKVSWRWCFWINVPIGGLAIAGLMLILPAKPPPRKHVGESFGQRIWQFDPVGTALLLPGLVMLLLALQWGGTQYAWSSARIVALLVLGVVLLIAFGISQLWSGENGTMPPRIIGQRSIAAATSASLTFGSTLIILTFYLPIWFQAIKGLSAVAAGVRLLPYFLTTVTFVITSGFLVSKVGYYTPVLIVGSAVLVVGCGLFTTFHVDTSKAKWIGYQIVLGAGMGTTLAQPNNAVQTVLSRRDIPIGITIITFAQFFGGSVFVTVCQAVLSNTLRAQLTTQIPGLDVAKLAQAGATDLAQLVPKAKLPVLLLAYNKALVNVFYCALAVSCATFAASWFLEWRTMRKDVKVEGGGGDGAAEVGVREAS